MNGSFGADTWLRIDAAKTIAAIAAESLLDQREGL
jgi:hypothetical protein